MSKQDWTNPPLACVVAGVYFDQILGFDDLLPAFHNEIRAILPGYVKEQVETSQQTQIGQFSVTQERHVFRNLSRDTALLVGDAGLVLTCNRYESFESFVSSALGPALIALRNVVPSGPILVKRYGLRYLDRILPREGEEPEDYVSEQLRHNIANAISGSLGADSGVSYVRCKMSQGVLDVKFFTGSGRPPLPPDLTPAPIEDNMPLALNQEWGVRRTGVIDTDRSLELGEVLDPEIALARYRKLHDDVSRAFKTIASDHALEVWGCPEASRP